MSLTTLDKALVIAQHELEAMRNQDFDKVDSFLAERKKLMEEVARGHDESSEEAYTLKLVRLQGYHQLIHDEGKKVYDSMKSTLVKSKKQTKMVKSYITRKY